MPAPARSAAIAPVRVLDLELAAEPPALADLERYVELQALVRRQGVPVGWIAVPVKQGRVPADEIERALAPLRMRSPAPPPERAGAPPTVTVAVCTRDRPDDLARCLDALERLDPPAAELLVVDNGPRGEVTERLVRTRHPRARYVQEPAPGLDHARNRAVAEAAGEILAFTDDDVVVDPGWAEALAGAFAGDPAVDAVTGLVVPYELETEAQVLFERYRSFARGFTPVTARSGDPARGLGWDLGNTGRFGTGANMAFRRSVFDRIGRFDPALGPGTFCRGGDDLEMLFRVLKGGGAIRYEPRAVVRHRHRREWAELLEQMRDSGIGFSASLARSAGAYREERVPLARLWGWWAAKLAFRAVRPNGAPAGALRELARAELGGVLRGWRRYRPSAPVPGPVAGSLTPA